MIIQPKIRGTPSFAVKPWMSVIDVFEPNGRNGAPTSWPAKSSALTPGQLEMISRSRTSPLEAYERSKNVVNGASRQKGFIVDPSTSFVASETPTTYGRNQKRVHVLLLVSGGLKYKRQWNKSIRQRDVLDPSGNHVLDKWNRSMSSIHSKVRR